MALKKLFQRLTAPVTDLDLERLQKFCESQQGVTRITDLPPRVEGTVVGEIRTMRIVPRAGSPSLEATITDGSGTLVVVWTGSMVSPEKASEIRNSRPPPTAAATSAATPRCWLSRASRPIGAFVSMRLKRRSTTIAPT